MSFHLKIKRENIIISMIEREWTNVIKFGKIT